MYHETKRFGRRGALLRAISALDIALWDVVSKKANIPINKLLGGNNDKILAYVSGGHYCEDNLFVEELRKYAATGCHVIKIKVGGASLQRDTERVRLARKTIGDEVMLCVDACEAWDLQTAVQAVSKWEKYDLLWIEEPIISENIDGLRYLRSKTSIPIALGENVYTRYAFRDLIVSGAIDVIQADVTRVGGITEWMRVAHLASAFDLKMAPHGMQEIHTQLLGAANNSFMVEFFSKDHRFQTLIDKIIAKPCNTRELRDGKLLVSETPGVGFSLDWEIAKKYVIT
jgi:D-arabinonate dehydratase